MKVLKTLLFVLLTFTCAAFGVLLLLQENKNNNYINIYGEDDLA